MVCVVCVLVVLVYVVMVVMVVMAVMVVLAASTEACYDLTRLVTRVGVDELAA